MRYTFQLLLLLNLLGVSGAFQSELKGASTQQNHSGVRKRRRINNGGAQSTTDSYGHQENLGEQSRRLDSFSDFLSDLGEMLLEQILGSSDDPSPSPSPKPWAAKNVENNAVTSNSEESCVRKDAFSSYVLVEHTLDDPENIDNTTYMVLGEAFKFTYNTLNAPATDEAICDEDKKRLVEHVAVFATEPIYKKINGERLATLDLIYKVGGTCRGCAEETTLFDMGDRRHKKHIKEMLRKDIPTTCSCRSDLSTGDARAMTDKEFKDAFRFAVGRLVAKGDLDNINSVNTVIEYDRVDCRYRPHEFETEVVVQLTTNPMLDDLEAVGDLFRNSYNKLATSFCDPDLRHIVDVELEDLEEIDERRRLEVDEKAKNVIKKLKKKKAYLMRVKGRCRGCRRKSKLFNNRRDKDDKDIGRYLAEDEDDERTRTIPRFDFRHEWDGTDKCFCATHSKAARAPSEEEVADELNMMLIPAYESGYISEEIAVRTINAKWLVALILLLKALIESL